MNGYWFSQSFHNELCYYEKFTRLSLVCQRSASADEIMMRARMKLSMENVPFDLIRAWHHLRIGLSGPSIRQSVYSGRVQNWRQIMIRSSDLYISTCTFGTHISSPSAVWWESSRLQHAMRIALTGSSELKCRCWPKRPRLQSSNLLLTPSDFVIVP